MSECVDPQILSGVRLMEWGSGGPAQGVALEVPDVHLFCPAVEDRRCLQKDGLAGRVDEHSAVSPDASFVS